MRTTKLLYIDSFGIGSFHETFNSSSLKMMSEIFNNVKHYSTKSSFEAVSNLLHDVPQNVNHHNILVLKPKWKIGRFLQLLSSFILNIYFVVFKLKKKDIAFFNYNSLWAMPFINWYCKKSKKKVIIMWHGELEFLYNNQRLNFISDKTLHWIQNKSVKVADSLFFCVAGKSIIKNLHLVVAKQFISHFISFEHTFISQNKNPAKISNGSKNIKIGTVGTINEYKGLSNILKIASNLKPYDNIHLYTLGRVFCDSQILKENNIYYIKDADKKFIPKEILNESIDKMDILIFLYPTNKYKLTASGAIFDSIDREKIILSLHNDYFDELFKKAFIGYQFDSIESMVDFIINLKEEDLPKVDYKKVKYQFSPESEALIFSKTLKQIYPMINVK